MIKMALARLKHFIRNSFFVSKKQREMQEELQFHLGVCRG